MELVKIEALLEKYFEAETSVKEEQQLKQFFSADEVPAHLEVYRPMFSYTVVESKIKDQHPYQILYKRRLSPWMKMAASITLIVSIGIFAKQYQQRKQAQYAYEQTVMALQLISSNFDKAKNSIAYLEVFEDTTIKIYKK